MKLIQLFAEFSLAYHARLRPKHFCAQSVTDSASLPLTTLSAKKVLSRETKTKALSAKDLSREVKNEAPLSTNSEAISASLTGITPCNKAKLPSKAELKQ